MQKKQKFLEEADSEEYLHKAAWQVVMRQIGTATNPTTISTVLLLSTYPNRYLLQQC